MQMAYLGKIRPIKSLYSRWNQCNMPCFNFYNKDLDLYYSGQKMCWSSLSEKRAFQRKVCLYKVVLPSAIRTEEVFFLTSELRFPKTAEPKTRPGVQVFLGWGCHPEDPELDTGKSRGEKRGSRCHQAPHHCGQLRLDLPGCSKRTMKNASQNYSPKRLRREVSINSHHPLSVALISKGLYMLQNAQMGFCMHPT